MPSRPSVARLPDPIRDELNQRLVASGFGDLDEQVNWLREQGVNISRSAVGRHNQKLKSTIEKALERGRARVEVAKALGGMDDGAKAALLESGELVFMDKVMEMMEDWESVKPEERPKALASLIRAFSDLGGSARGTAKLRREHEAEVRRQALEEAAARVDATARTAGLSAQTVEQLRREILGIAA
jgi:hypothetical protein